MCASRHEKSPPKSRRTFGLVVATVIASAFITACSDNTRTGSTFCKRLQDELPGITQPMESQGDVRTMVSRYKRLLDVAPLSIEEDFRVLVDLLDLAADSDPNDPDSLQEVADAAYAANTSSLQVSEWIYDTCAVDFVTGMNVAPPRTPAPPTIPPDTSVPDAGTEESP
jgi:hypothetical protein